MPAKNLSRIDKEKTYSHVFNRGIEKRIIFSDQEDYGVFLAYLEGYFTTPRDPESTKKAFTVNGQVFRGTPHQPKNYFGKVELVAYSLMPSHFHLLLHQVVKGSTESLLRSLCTRYSMYFNKKCNRSGALFEGPYKSVAVGDEASLLLLTRYFHYGPKEAGVTSYAEYLSSGKSPWIKPKVVLASFEKAKNDSFEGVSSYKDFVEKYELGSKENEILKKIVLETNDQHISSEGNQNYKSSPAQELAAPLESKAQPSSASTPRVPEFIGMAVVFFLLVGLGLRNIKATEAKNFIPSPTPIVLSTETEVEPKKVMLAIKIEDGAESVNIRSSPEIASEKLGTALEGEKFEFVSIDSGWYQVKLPDGSNGFISAKYIEMEEPSE